MNDCVLDYDNEEKYYVYFLCDPNKKYFNFGEYTLPHEPFYCGKGTLKRINSKKRNKAVNDKINSMGISPKIFYIGPFNEKDAFDIEDYFVDYFKRRDLYEDGVLLNLQNGGYGGKRPSYETVLKMKKSHLNKVPWNKNLKTGKPSWNTGIKMSDEFSSKVSDGVRKTFENGRKTWNKGKTYSLGENHHNSKEVIVNGFKYESLKDAENKTGISRYILKKRYM